MFMICKEAQVKILGYINRSNYIDQVITFSDMTDDEKNSNRSLEEDKLRFILECLIIYGQMTSEQVKNNFKDILYSGKLLAYLKEQIESDMHENRSKAIEILYYIANVDPDRFFNHLVD